MNIRIASLALAALLAGIGGAEPVRAAPQRKVPLVVMIVVDQMRASYLDDYGSLFTAGFQRLMREGAWFQNARYPYLNTVTCAGHSTIGTGAFPYRHGMVLNAWWDRKRARSVTCTADSTVKNIGYGETPSGGDSASNLLAVPLAQQIEERTGGRAVVMSLKPRSSIPLAGAKPTAIVWFDEQRGWTTSTAFTPKPIEWLEAYFTAHPFSDDQGKIWERTLPVADYKGEDADKAERSPSGWTTTFPYRLGDPPASFRAQWQRSPFADEYLGRLAAHAIETLDLGRGTGVDYLGVSFSTLDLVGHQYGPASHEVQDVLVRLDRTIGRLLDLLDARVGRDNYVLALSADHGVAVIPEQTGGSRLPSSSVIAAVDGALAPVFGAGKYVAHTAYTDIYLLPGVLDRIKKSPRAWTAVSEALGKLPGITRVFRSDDVMHPSARQSADPALRAAALSYHPLRSGDVIIVPRENWLLSTSATTHGTLYAYDQRVPVIFFGKDVPPGLHAEDATPADIAPTLATLAGIRLEPVDGLPRLGTSEPPQRR